ncbi:methionine ABC transporter ATP-binding protein [Paraburkholderia phenoliruptrix]|uniref:Cell division ATP-binding protein FtsE n=2 Tax=Paraburkholderia phenoliruptrix TaxID=252970 RepID=K0DU04_9BURK|nr:ATP-binding cassette domain-containing protein [Paraburkholderia phenoliruptrix]AFT88177.1 D-methionine transport system ATP-binding protein [Paraburkholderia phenoliruptrix BR3459a]MDR6418430.1 D-methionine transport system ATP-binding protein [Paraburkholderia phenoliruptrix]CAB4047099.1 Methionine import ATP-binding protein MetN [Paraburkholderia phenoliruptrix]
MATLFDVPQFIEDAPSLTVDERSNAAPTQAAVVFDNVGKVFAGARGASTAALADVTLNVARGEVFGIIGRSGAGKSTLLRLVNGLEKPSSGAVTVNGVNVGELDERGLVALRRRIGMVFQHFNLLSAKTVRENIALPLRIAGVPKAAIDKKVDALLELVGLAAKRDAYPASLSGGQKQRVGIARALVTDPDIVLCDEATSALDPETTQAILALLRDINRRLNLTVVLITHEMQVIREVCDTVAVIERGRVVETGPVWRVFGDPQHDATRALLRTLVHDLPADLAERVKPLAGIDQTDVRVLLDVRFTGDTERDPDLAALARALSTGDSSVNFVHGGIDRIQGHAQGRVIVSAAVHASGQTAVAAQVAALLDRARGHANHVEVLGYV